MEAKCSCRCNARASKGVASSNDSMNVNAASANAMAGMKSDEVCEERDYSNNGSSVMATVLVLFARAREESGKFEGLGAPG